jgi:ATP-dependent DNA ligase
MLSSPTSRLPSSDGWILQPKWDGFRLLVHVDEQRRVRAWSRHGTDLTDRLGDLPHALSHAPAGTTFDGELVAIGERDGSPTQDFAAVRRAVFNRDAAATARLCLVAFDLLDLAGHSIRGSSWEERDALLADSLPQSTRAHLITSQPAIQDARDAIVALGFEGTVLKRRKSGYRPGRRTAWLKYKTRLVATGQALSAHRDNDGAWYLRCDVDGRSVTALAGRACDDLVGGQVRLHYSRLDADGSLREARLAPSNGRRARLQTQDSPSHVPTA